jgi:hypothetical protein
MALISYTCSDCGRRYDAFGNEQTQRCFICQCIVELTQHQRPPHTQASAGGQIANTQFTELPGVIAQAPVQNAPPVATAQNGQAVHAYVSNSSRGTWLFQPDQNDGGGNGG